MGRTYKKLKARQRAERDRYPQNLSLRVHRALSWLDRAEQESDLISRLIFLWIALNAADATEIDDRVHVNEQATFKPGQQNTPVVLSIVFSRLYTLRNQIMRGGATGMAASFTTRFVTAG